MKLFTVPNLFTLANLFSGSLACIFLLLGYSPNILIWFLIACLIFDFFDGFVARFTKTNSELGVQLDSLADMVSFGFFPSLLMFKLLHFDLFFNQNQNLSFNWEYAYCFIALAIVLFSALRLAKFNLDKEQTYYFKGLPTPANTIFIFSIYEIIFSNNSIFINHPYFLISLIALSCYLLISNIPLSALKFKGFQWKGNELKFIFLLISLILLIFLKIIAIPIIIVAYIIVSMLFKNQIKNGKI